MLQVQYWRSVVVLEQEILISPQQSMPPVIHDESLTINSGTGTVVIDSHIGDSHSYT